MKLTFIQPTMFRSQWKRMKLTDEDLQALEKILLRDPDAGVIVTGTGGVRKIRFAPPSWHRGKSGSSRVCYVCFAKAGHCYLLDIYTHNEKDNLSDVEKAGWKKFVAAIKQALNED